MALQVWLPLNGNSNNHGLADGDIITSNVTYDTRGKIGNKSLSGGTITLPATMINKFYNKDHMSFAFWLCALGTSGSSSIIGQTSMGAGNNRMYTIFQYSTPLNLHLSWQDETSSSTFLGGTWENFFIQNEWIHCAITYDGSKAIIYRNGVQYTIVNGVSNRAVFNYDVPINGGSIRLLNDFRIYDHVLSAKEVTEIAKGLVLHYPLCTSGENLLSRYVVPGQNAPTVTTDAGRTKYYGDYGIIIPAQENADTYFRLFLREQLVQNTVYTISCNASGVLNGTSYSFPLFAQGNGAMGYLYIDHNGLCSLTFTMTYSTQTAITVGNETVYLCFMDDGSRTIASGQGAITLTNFKIEKGSNATPWVPATTDPKYNAYGFNIATIHDTSGFGYNGTQNGTLISGSDSPRYRSSTIFNGSDNAIQIPFNTMIGTELTDYSISVWFYKESIGTKNYQTIFGGPSGYELEARVSSGSDPLIKLYSWGGGQYAYQFNVWNHLVFVQTTTEVKCYLNGELVISGGTPKANPSGNYFIGSWNTTTQQNFEGKMSDFRIYVTALTADQVKELYSISISISDNGTLFANEFCEY